MEMYLGKFLKVFGCFKKIKTLWKRAAVSFFTTPYFSTEISAESAYHGKVEYCFTELFSIPELKICSFFL